MTNEILKWIGSGTCICLLYQFASLLIAMRIKRYLLESGWSKFKIDTEYNHNQLKYRVEKLEKNNDK